MDDRLKKIEGNQEELGDKIDKLQARLNYLAGVLVAVSFFMNLLAPIVVERVFGK